MRDVAASTGTGRGKASAAKREGKRCYKYNYPARRASRCRREIYLVVLRGHHPHAAQGFPTGTHVSVHPFLTSDKGTTLVLDT